MLTIKLKYNIEDKSNIKEYIRQYTILYHCAYNFIYKNYTLKDIKTTKFELENKNSSLKQKLSKLNIKDKDGNTIQLPLSKDSWIVQSCIDEAFSQQKKEKVIFGGKKNFLDRIKHNISHDELKQKRQRSYYCIGEASKTTNRKFRLSEDLSYIEFKPSRKEKYILNINPKNYYSQLSKLYLLQIQHKAPISYRLGEEFIYISFDENNIYNYNFNKKENRVLGIDLNPNYIGWSIVDWTSSNEYNIIKSGVFSIKELNDKQSNLKENSSSPKSKRLNNIRTNDIILISKKIVQFALYYKCESIVLEDLNIKTNDKNKGKKLNRLCNNYWNRNTFIDNIKKRCSIYKIICRQVPPQYSSFISNIIFRQERKPDMVLASIEIGRRGYEFINQYIKKKKDIKHNIVLPLLDDFKDQYRLSLEELNIKEIKVKSNIFKVLYDTIKKSKTMYRLSLNKFNLEFSTILSPKLKLGCVIFKT